MLKLIILRVTHFVIGLFLLIVACACLGSDARVKSVNILFVGNSLTYSNNLPLLVEALAKKNGHKIKTEMLAFPNYALEDHWNDGRLQTLISSNQFSHVVVQQGPSSQTDGKEMLLSYGAKIKSLCEKHQAKLAFYMVWPSKANYNTYDGVIANYLLAAEQTNSLVCPVGKAWKEHFDSTNNFSYYGPDNFHPSPEGSQVAAQIIYDVIFEVK
jgi:hypothetical protein